MSAQARRPARSCVSAGHDGQHTVLLTSCLDLHCKLQQQVGIQLAAAAQRLEHSIIATWMQAVVNDLDLADADLRATEASDT